MLNELSPLREALAGAKKGIPGEQNPARS